MTTKDYINSPRDLEGHGTHASSIAAGNLVNMASMFGFAQGTIRGGVPSAHGVDLLSVSLGGDSIESIHLTDGVSVGAFHAMQHGGVSLNTFDLEGKFYPIVYGGDVSNTVAGVDGHKSRFCQPNTLNNTLVKGKIVLCEIDENLGFVEVMRMGVVGLLIWGKAYKDDAYPFPLPACYLQPKDGAKIYKYIRSTRRPSATIFRTVELNDTLAPMVASFSSRGPNNVTADILKPDLIAPGVNILASWSTITPISDYLGENRKSEYKIVSGTSMACPHVSGAAAFIKSFHPTWSPAAIRSSLMTTAKQMSPRNMAYAEFGYGAGEIDPVKALNPVLIYDANADDYFRFLCGVGFNKTILQKITRDNSTCSNTTHISARITYFYI
ncbi:hypothetical protein TSUD_243580 [Trifolium subterraneum]|uniref:Peptidase S8/S53 domain-containing protein n=1 Tax=Trifolium subterraneum TaxID=3900 RepID=A0A2Z6P2T1_TRISU|nr:hypothetical protein TSUD_243580 [Trifolium subterraneum]